jgi:hypothetical protein
MFELGNGHIYDIKCYCFGQVLKQLHTSSIYLDLYQSLGDQGRGR